MHSLRQTVPQYSWPQRAPADTHGPETIQLLCVWIETAHVNELEETPGAGARRGGGKTIQV